MSAEQRQFPRQEIQIEVVLSFLEDTARTVTTRDMSKGGLFLQLNDTDRYPMGEMVNLHFKNPLNNLEETEKDGVVVRRCDDGIAIAFIEMEEF
jgi:PilZ domain